MNYTLLGTAQDIQKVEEGTSILFKDICPCTKEENLNITVVFQNTNELVIVKEENQVRITCKEPAHYFRGLTWVLYHLNEDIVRKTETVYFPKNGFMMDCSRNSVFTTDKIKSLIRTFAKLGMNEMMLYTEETYTVPEEPYFGIYRGRYSQEEIREMDDYAQIFGIELVPCIQTLAHLRNALKWPLGTDIKDTTDILMVGEEKVYVFIEELLRAIKNSFHTNRVHLGMDEAAELGRGNYLSRNGFTPSAQLIKEHCARVYEICQKLDLEPMIWSDMYITANTGKGYYDIDHTTDTSNWKKPVDGLGMVYWDYYHDDITIYRDMLRVHTELSPKLSFAGGAWIWNGISPNYGKAFRCTIPALTAAKEYQVPHVFCTAWMDNGAETPVDAVYPGMVLFAYLCFHMELDKQELAEEFQDIIGGRLEDFYELDAFDSMFVGMGNNLTGDNPSKYLLFQDTLLGMFDYHVKDIDTAAYYKDLAVKMAACQESSPAYRDLFRYYELLAEVLSEKAGMGIRVKSAYEKKDLSTLEQICGEVIPHVIDTLWKMKLLREELWLRDAKPFGYELLDIKLGGVITRMESHKRRIRSYLDGKVSSLAELEQERLPYFPVSTSIGHGDDVSLCENKWNRIISGCDLIDTL